MTTLRITTCGDCPFVYRDSSHWPVPGEPDAWCEHESRKDVPLEPDVVAAAAPPSWCPLRTEPTVVELAETAPPAAVGGESDG